MTPMIVKHPLLETLDMLSETQEGIDEMLKFLNGNPSGGELLGKLIVKGDWHLRLETAAMKKWGPNGIFIGGDLTEHTIAQWRIAFRLAKPTRPIKSWLLPGTSSGTFRIVVVDLPDQVCVMHLCPMLTPNILNNRFINDPGFEAHLTEALETLEWTMEQCRVTVAPKELNNGTT